MNPVLNIMIIIVIVSLIGFTSYIIYDTNKQTKPLIKIPLVNKGVQTGQWVECHQGDKTYKQLKKVYGFIPTQIEVESLINNKIK